MKNKYKLSYWINLSAIGLFALFCMIPMLLVVMVSLTDEAAIRRYGYQLIPSEFSLGAYRLILTSNTILANSYMISIIVTLIGIIGAVLITGMAGFALANKQVRYRNALALFFFITMIFNTGLVPWYMINTALGLRNNLWALIIPSLLFNPFNLFLVRNYMNGLPDSLMESAKIDGAGDARIAFKIYFPLSVPVLATVALFYGLGYWNNWFNAIMLVNNQRIYPLQYLLMRLQSEIRMISELQAYETSANMPTESLKMATAIVTIGPIVFLYPYLQRYFVKGLIVGSVKG